MAFAFGALLKSFHSRVMMFERKYNKTSRILCLLWCLSCLHCQIIAGVKSNEAVEQLSFSCVGRPAGYYADIESGCQVYHMCDGLGQQFSYTCPNTTLFQQRMLICDHWYMVNCSKAERDYTVNFLIGQRNKPFVNDEEMNLRTPRPDLLDRNYLTDYSTNTLHIPNKQSGNTFNHIVNNDVQKHLKNNQRQQHWRITAPTQTILPPSSPRHQENNIAETKNLNKPANKPNSQYQRRQSRPIVNNHFHQPDADDLGTSHSTRYNTSADFESKENTNTNNIKLSNAPIIANTQVKVPSRIYQPPFLYPIYNENDTLASKKTPLQISTAAPFQTRSYAAPRFNTFATTTLSPPSSHATTLRGKPFTVPSYNRDTTRLQNPNFSIQPSVTANPKHNKEHETNKLVAAKAFQPIFNTYSKPSTEQIVPPEKTLQPPKTSIIIHDVASTQGPPIYYEWKEPTNGLLPPKLDPPYGVNGREYPKYFDNYGSPINPGNLNQLTSSFEQKLQAAKEHKNNEPTTHQPSARSVKSIDSKTASSKTQTRSILHPKQVVEDIEELRKTLAVPEFTFPLENVARTGYGAEGSFNSFQLKIPEISDKKQTEHWYGENSKCPECHPSFVKPGTCEPCIKR